MRRRLMSTGARPYPKLEALREAQSIQSAEPSEKDDTTLIQ
jgi:hypothetical protein